MNANTAQYILEHQNDSAASIAAALSEDPRFAGDVTRTQLRGLFAATTIGVRLKWAASNEQVPVELRAGAERVLMTAGWEDGVLRLTVPAYAVEFRDGVEGFVAASILTQEEGDQILALAGGPYYTPLTESEVQAELDRLADEAAALTLRQQWAAVYNAGVALIDAGVQSGNLPSLTDLRAVEG